MTLPIDTGHTTTRDRHPLRVLLVSAAIGRGHDSAADALEEAARRTWPGTDIARADTFTAMRRGSGGFFRVSYAAAVRWFPVLHELWFASVRSVPAVRWFYREVIGRWSGRGLAAEIERHRPDVVVSTYPLGTAGVARLRRAGRLRAPLVAVITDFAPHPFWAYRGVDRYVVLSDRGAAALRPFADDADVVVGRPPVASRFTAPGPGPTPARGSGLTTLVTSGSLGLGQVDEAVDAALAAGPHSRAVVVCGHNDRLRRRLLARAEPADRLVVPGWVQDMVGLLDGVDVVVNDAGGVSALEAMARGRALVMFRPIAGHGRASARMLADEGLAPTCHDRAALGAHLRELALHPELLTRAQHRARAFVHDRPAHDLAAVLAPLLEQSRATGTPTTGERRPG
jgi:diacylglycerol O-acyltransferase